MRALILSLPPFPPLPSSPPSPPPFYAPQNRFDFFVVGLSYVGFMIDLGSITVLRLLRLLRVVRLLNKFPALKSITTALLHAFSAVGYVMLMICLVDYIFAVIGMLMFRKNDPVHFGRMSTALMTMWAMETMDYPGVLYINMLGCDEFGYGELALGCNEPRALGWYAVCYVLVVVVLGGMVMPTVLLGVISIAFDESTGALKQESLELEAVGKVMARAHSWSNFYVSSACRRHRS